MKILFLTNIPTPYRVDFFDELGKSCALTVAFQAQGFAHRHPSWENFQAHFFHPLFLKPTLHYKNYTLCGDVLDQLKKKWDVIVVGGYASLTNILAIEYMRLKKIPFYLEVDGGLIHPDNKLKFWFKKYLISAASGWLSSGKETTQYLTHYGANPTKIYEYPFTSLWQSDISARMPTIEQKQALRKELGIIEDKVLISVGRFTYQNGYGKGYDVLMKVSETLPTNIGVYIIGDEPTAEFIHWKEEKKLIHVHFVKFQPKEALKKWYQAADVFVLPTREDIWGLVINEAMSQGLPVITTDKCVAGLELVKEGENGYITLVGDIAALTRAITQIFSQDCRLMGQKSLERISQYTLENMAYCHVKCFNDIKRK